MTQAALVTGAGKRLGRAMALALADAGHDVAVPAYDFTTYTRSGRFEVVVPRPFVIIEGILLFAFAEIRDELDFLIFREGSEEARAECALLHYPPRR